MQTTKRRAVRRQALRPRGDAAAPARAPPRSSGRAGRPARAAPSRRRRPCRWMCSRWKASSGCEVLGEDAQRPRVVAVEELLVLVRERGASGVVRSCALPRAAKSMKPRSTSVRTQLHAHAVADVEPLEAAHDACPPTGGCEDAHPGPLLGGAGHDARRTAAPIRACEQQRRRRLPHLPLHLGGVVLLLGAVPRRAPPARRSRTAAARPASAAFSRRCVIRSGKRRFGAVECV